MTEPALVPDEMKAQCGQLAQLVRQAFAKKNYNYHLFRKNQIIAHNKAGIYCVSPGMESAFGEFEEEAPLAFKIEFGADGTVVFHDYSGLQSVPDLIAVNGFWGRMCDFTRSIVSKAINVTSITVQKVGKVVAATVEFVLDGVKQVVNFVLKTVKDILNSVIAIFQAFKMDFERLFRWLGQLFSWNDIMETKKFLSSLVDDFLRDFSDNFINAGQHFSEKIGYVLNESDQTAARIKEAMPEGFDAQKESEKMPVDSPFYEGQSNNVVLNRLVDMNGAVQGYSCAAILPAGFEESVTSLLDEILDCVRKFGTGLEDEVKKKTETFIASFKTMQILDMLDKLVKILKELLTFVRNPMVTLIDGLGDLLSRLTDMVRQILNTEVIIPLVTPFLKKIFGVSGITVLDIVCTVIAIPTTIIHKLVCGTPFRPASGTLGNAYGWLKSAYILSALCASLYYSLWISGIFGKPEKENWITLIVFGVLPLLLFLIWTVVNLAEVDTQKDSETTDTIATFLSLFSVAMLLTSLAFSYAEMIVSADMNDIKISQVIDAITIVLGIISIIIGAVDMKFPEEWTTLDIVSQRNGLLTGLADIATALSSLLNVKTTAKITEKDESAAVKPSVIAAVAGGVLAAAETACLVAEAIVKPFIESISPNKGVIGRSGTVKIMFDEKMNIIAGKGQVLMDKSELPFGIWNDDRTYTANYMGLEANREYYLIVQGFKNTNGWAMEKDLYLVTTGD